MRYNRLILVFFLFLSILAHDAAFAQWKAPFKRKKQEAKLADVTWDRETQGQLRIFCNPKARLFVDALVQRDPKGKIRASQKFVVALSVGKHKIRMDSEGMKLVACTFVDHEKKSHKLPVDDSGVIVVNIVAGAAHSINFTLAKTHHVKNAMVLVPAGEFVMGLSGKPKKKGGKSDLGYIVERIGGEKRFHRNETPRHKVKVEAFHMDTYEVSNAQYQEFIQAKERPLPDDWENGSYPPGKGDYPVIYVTWDDADAYCKWAGKRLPTEAEWEKAARWETNRKGRPIAYFFPWGDSFKRGKANTASGGPGKVMPVGSYEDGMSPYGAYDMAGNVKEWIADWYEDYPGNTFEDIFTDGAKVKVARGGSWRDKKYDVLGSCRFKYSLSHADDDLGFRCVKDKK